MKHSLSIQDIAVIAMGTATIALCSWISIPTAIPFTLQTFAVCLVTAIFGLKRGMWMVLCYLLLGAAGAPVFAGFQGGIVALLGPTGGYLLGFLFTALIIGFAVEKLGRSLSVLISSMTAGILICYTFGTAWFMFVYSAKTGPIGLGTALSWCVFPFLLPDALKIALAAVLTGRLYPFLNREVKKV